MNQKAISEPNRRSAGCGRLFIGVWGLGFFSAGILFIWFMAISPFLNSRAAASWPTAPCKILSSKVESHTDSEGDRSYSAKIEFEFELDGGKMVGDRYSFSSLAGSSAAANKIVKKYPPGLETICYYDPQDPSQSVLSRELDASLIWFALFPLIFVVIGGVAISAALFGWGFRGKRNSRTAVSSSVSPIDTDGSKHPQLMDHPRQSTHAADFEDEQWSVPMKLKTKQSRWVSLLAVLAVTVFWNGVVSVFVFALIMETNGIWGRIGFGLFLTPFALIGLFLASMCFYLFLQLFTPRVEVALSSGAVPLGGEVDIAWEVIGRTSRLQSLKLEVQAEQSATYRQGTDTRTDKEIFEVIPISNVTSQDAIRFGSATVQIPDSTMHTHEGTNNQVTWSVVVHGEIKWWPDVFESFPFRVKPVSDNVS